MLQATLKSLNLFSRHDEENKTHQPRIISIVESVPAMFSYNVFQFFKLTHTSYCEKQIRQAYKYKFQPIFTCCRCETTTFLLEELYQHFGRSPLLELPPWRRQSPNNDTNNTRQSRLIILGRQYWSVHLKSPDSKYYYFLSDAETKNKYSVTRTKYAVCPCAFAKIFPDFPGEFWRFASGRNTLHTFNTTRFGTKNWPRFCLYFCCWKTQNRCLTP